MRDEIVGGGDDLRDAGLVVGAEQRRARCRDDVVPDLCRQLRMVRRAQHRRWIVGQHDVASVPVAMHDRRDTSRRHLRRRIDMRDEPDRRHVAPAVAGMVAIR